jgi:hypothetical protein
MRKTKKNALESELEKRDSFDSSAFKGLDFEVFLDACAHDL